jgi:phage terminase small subunit
MAAKKAIKKTVAKKAAKKPAKKAAKKALPKLKPKYQTFTENVIANGGNATAAARKAGVKGSDAYVSVAAHRMLRNDKVQEYIQTRTRERLKGVKANADELYFLLADHLRADIADLDECMRPDGGLDLKLAKQMDVSRLVKKLKTRIGPGGDIITEIELHDSQAAAGRLAKLMGLEQAPRQNQDDVARFNAELAKLVSEGWDPEKARQIVIEAEPAASRYLN